MDMVFVSSNFNKMQIIGWSKSKTDFLQCCFYGFREHFSAILSWTNEVIKKTTDIVLFANMLWHTHSIPLRLTPRSRAAGKSITLYCNTFFMFAKYGK